MELVTLLTLVLMAVVTYLTRIAGFIAFRNRPLSRRAKAVLESIPGCVLISVIAPAFVSSHPANMLALGITLLAAMRFSILPTVVISIVATGFMRQAIM